MEIYYQIVKTIWIQVWSLKFEERQEPSNKELNKNKSSGNNSQKMQGYMDVDSFKPWNHQQVNPKCDKDIKGCAENESAGNINFTYHRENIVRNHGTSTITTNSTKENKNKNTESKRNAEKRLNFIFNKSSYN